MFVLACAHPTDAPYLSFFHIFIPNWDTVRRTGTAAVNSVAMGHLPALQGNTMSQFLRAALIVLSLALAACATTTGRPFNADAANHFVDGRTTLREVRRELGDPQTTQQNPDGSAVWLYNSSHSSASFRDFVPFAGASSNTTMQALHLTFDKQGVLASHTLTTSN